MQGVDNVHAHRFRRTLATNLLRKGMPIEKVKGSFRAYKDRYYINLNKYSTKKFGG